MLTTVLSLDSPWLFSFFDVTFNLFLCVVRFFDLCVQIGVLPPNHFVAVYCQEQFLIVVKQSNILLVMNSRSSLSCMFVSSFAKWSVYSVMSYVICTPIFFNIFFTLVERHSGNFYIEYWIGNTYVLTLIHNETIRLVLELDSGWWLIV